MALKLIINELEKLCLENDIDITHGLDHALAVMNNALHAIPFYEGHITKREKYLIQLAALLHDSDDAKYFPNNKNNENTRKILTIDTALTFEEIELIIFMINQVSTSKNKDNIPEGYPLWVLLPRYSDRLEAIGLIGVERTLEYTRQINQPLFLESTPKAKTIQELALIATPERYASYSSASVSMFDHIYDKLLHTGNFPIKNKFFNNECKKRMKPLIDLALKFGNSENGLTFDEIEQFIIDNKQ